MKNHDIPDIAQCVEYNIKRYFKDLDGEQPCAVYDMVLNQVEKPLLECVMAECGGNQSKAAAILGLNRNTLRKKLLQHGLLEG
ncbi:Fis family transcriptional regulator [Neisseria perflava]|uniref:Fis family transcriptional regulator n=1 Tax=Neisseria perflava TaxID=33053 RepID=UPI00209C7F7E|nr:Fis family transcriptional regulator [Neisseria perflava]MCP1659956.1 Fis family transcriptional regulator [Neisseria perflava]MCP1772196.1 Fis family transcriptional regulator [Neisseria perflava]